MIFERKILKNLTQDFDELAFTIISGPRQCGKTTLLKQVEDILRQRGQVVYSMTLEDPLIKAILDEHPEKLFGLIAMPKTGRSFVLIDEIQYLQDPSNFLKLLFDKYKDRLKVIATGSSAFYIDKNFTDSLAGRKRLFELFTLDFDEYLHFSQGDPELLEELNRIRNEPEYISLRRNELLNAFSNYITFGGYPAVVLADTIDKKKNLLKELIGSYIKRDIYESRVLEEDKFIRLLMILADQTGSLVNNQELSRTLRISSSAIESYLYILRKCYHVHLLRPFYNNIRKELIKMPKIYFHDLGFRNALINNFEPFAIRQDRGELLENYMFIRLREKVGTDGLRYWRTADGAEIDFIVEESFLKGTAIEVKSTSAKVNRKKYARFLESYPKFNLNFRTLDSKNNDEHILGF